MILDDIPTKTISLLVDMESHSHVVFLQSKVIVMDLAAAKNRVSHVSQASNPSSKTS